MVHKIPPVGFSQRKLTYGPYSPSRLITAKCPARFFGQYVRKDRVVGAAVNADRGSAIHEVLAKITTARSQELIITPKQLEDWIAEAIGKYPAAYQQIDLVRDAAHAYVANPSPYANKGTFCEKSFAVQLWEEDSFDEESVHDRAYVETEYTRGAGGGDFFFGGHIDQLSVDEDTKVVTILDHKSTPSANENEDHNFQVGAYAWLVSLFYPGYKIRTVLHYCHPRLNFYGSPVEWYREDLQEMETYILSRVRALEAMQSFPSVPGTGCGYCHMTQECEIFSKVREQKANGALDLNVRSIDDLQRLAGELHVIDSLSGEITKVLKEGINTLCPTNGVDIGGVWYGNKTSEESVDWQATDKKIREESERAKIKIQEGRCESEEDRRYCEEVARYESLDSLLSIFGLKPNNYKVYSGPKMNNIFRDDKPRLLELLSVFAVRKKTTRFGAHRR